MAEEKDDRLRAKIAWFYIYGLGLIGLIYVFLQMFGIIDD